MVPTNADDRARVARSSALCTDFPDGTPGFMGLQWTHRWMIDQESVRGPGRESRCARRRAGHIADATARVRATRDGSAWRTRPPPVGAISAAGSVTDRCPQCRWFPIVVAVVSCWHPPGDSRDFLPIRRSGNVLPTGGVPVGARSADVDYGELGHSGSVVRGCRMIAEDHRVDTDGSTRNSNAQLSTFCRYAGFRYPGQAESAHLSVGARTRV